MLGGGDDADEIGGGRRGEKGVAVCGILEQAAEHAEDLKIIARARLGCAEHEHHADVFAPLERDANIAAADGEDDLLDVIGAGMGHGKAVAEAGGVEAIPGEQLVVETVEIEDVRVMSEQLGDLVEGGRALGAFHLQQNAGGIEKLGDATGHAGNRRRESFEVTRGANGLASAESNVTGK